jgi:hypothetical protein
MHKPEYKGTLNIREPPIFSMITPQKKGLVFDKIEYVIYF